MSHVNRRRFLKFLGTAGAFALLPGALAGCEHRKWPRTKEAIGFKVKGIEPNDQDALILAAGLQYDLLIRYNDDMGHEMRFGYNNDYTYFIADEGNPDSGLLWVNHEYIKPHMVSGRSGKSDPNKEQADLEMYHVGGSFIRIVRAGGKWKFVPGDPGNRRLTAHTPIPFAADKEIMGTNVALGTVANCAGGYTPWGNILSCEENYHDCFGERQADGSIKSGLYRWEKVYPRPPEHYGWVVEVDPRTGKAEKQTALGRFAHECATTVELKDGRVVVYTGDDKDDECLYKFISSKPGSLEEGTLYVADIDSGKWISLDRNSDERLMNRFASQLDLLIHTRIAAHLVGGSKLDRPEDIEIDPVNGDVFIALTNNKPRKEYFGQILKIREAGGNYESMQFESETFRTGGVEIGFACPDNMAFDNSGNLWFTSDMSGSSMHKPPYEKLKNNGLFVVPRSGELAGEVIQMASAPTDAEFTGPTFSPDGTSLFLCVQHPGELSPENLSSFTSHWPDGSGAPKPAVVVITGPALEHLTHLRLAE